MPMTHSFGSICSQMQVTHLTFARLLALWTLSRSTATCCFVPWITVLGIGSVNWDRRPYRRYTKISSYDISGVKRPQHVVVAISAPLRSRREIRNHSEDRHSKSTRETNGGLGN